MGPQAWGVTTQKDKKIYLHIFNKPGTNTILLPGVNDKVKQVSVFGTAHKIKYNQAKEGLSISLNDVNITGPDTIVLVEFK